jgi:hypothetical protein
LGAEITSAELAASDPAWWATKHNTIRLQKGNYSFDGREYLLEPLCSRAQRMTMMKGTQGGASITVMLLALWGMIYKHFERGVLYLFPTATDVREFSQAVLNPLLAANRSALGRWVKTTKGGTDTTTLKQVNGANFFMRGASLPKIIDGQVGESTQMKGISSDLVVYDEVELMDPEALAKARGRTGASVDVVDGVVDYDTAIARNIFIGNPGIPGYGIDKIFGESDQRHWFRKCQHCGRWTCAEESFPDCVKIRENGRGYIGCMNCGKEVFVRDGQWVPKVMANSDYMHGYRWSQLTSPCPQDPGQILEDFTNPPENNLADVYRIQLGLPYVNAEDRLMTMQVLSRCGPFLMRAKDPGPCAFGLDVGKINHLVIGKRIGQNSFEIVKIAQLSEWAQIEQMIDEFNCQSGVVDVRPYEATVRRFQREMKHIRIFLCEYSETTAIGTLFNSKTGMVKVNRTEICDATHNLVTQDGMLMIPRNCDTVQEFARQVCDPVKVLEVNKKTKQAVYRYRGTNDHYRHALNYFLLAAGRIGIAPKESRRRRRGPGPPETVMNDYKRI